ncbi:MAG: biotin/lipoyl-containing protein [Candidatus Poseidoniaceae archaeon]|jgi:acetyl/propionyl-CoA carboxylase alpha subunit|nr:biotin/lipoyl-containing protein [Candidatus Poseidoniaceae archaeon]MDP7203176.1 biotin/lipoyl-containing protein [Candidatus Poseidoniaceae archaeon]
MQNEFQDCNSEKWVVTLSSSAHGFTVEAMSRGAENIAVDVRAERKGSKILLSDGTMATLCKVGDDWWIHHSGRTHKLQLIEPGLDSSEDSEGSLVAPMPGTILDVMVTRGEQVAAGQALILMEAMKMEHKVVAPTDGLIEALLCSQGDRVEQGAVLIELSGKE